MYRVVLVFVLCFVSSLAQDQLQTLVLQGVRGICCFTSGVDSGLLQQVRNGDLSSNDPRLENYGYCVYRLLTISNGDGTINEKRALPLLPPRTDKIKFRSAVAACNGIRGSSKEDTSWKILQCYNQQYPGDIFAL